MQLWVLRWNQNLTSTPDYQNILCAAASPHVSTHWFISSITSSLHTKKDELQGLQNSRLTSENGEARQTNIHTDTSSSPQETVLIQTVGFNRTHFGSELTSSSLMCKSSVPVQSGYSLATVRLRCTLTPLCIIYRVHQMLGDVLQLIRALLRRLRTHGHADQRGKPAVKSCHEHSAFPFSHLGRSRADYSSFYQTSTLLHFISAPHPHSNWIVAALSCT